MKLTRFILLFAIPYFLVGCSDTPNPTQPKKNRVAKQHTVLTTNVQNQSLIIERQYPASLVYRTVARIYSEEEGKINHLPWYEGDKVNKSDNLVIFDNRIFSAEKSIADANVKLAQKALDRIQNLANKKVASADALFKAQTALNIALAEQKLATIHLDNTIIRAPFDGVVSERLVDPGDVVSQHTHLLTLFSPSSLIVESEIPAFILPSIEQATSAEVTINALGKHRYPVNISRIHPQINRQTHKGVIELSFNPIPQQATGGQTATLHLSLTRPPHIVLPFKSIRHDRLGAYVFRLINNRAKRTAITIGIQQSNLIEVSSGLQPGDEVIIEGFPNLTDNKKVTRKGDSRSEE